MRNKISVHHRVMGFIASLKKTLNQQIGTFRLDYEHEIEYECEFEFQTSDVSRVLAFKITTTATATGTSLNKRFNEQNNGSARAL